MNVLAAVVSVVLVSVGRCGDVLPLLETRHLTDTVGKSERTLIFFTRATGCAQCDTVAAVLPSVLEQSHMPSHRIEDATVAAVYADRVPAVVLFFKHTPVLYEGPMDEESIGEFLMSVREPLVVTLNDETFEHLTQASTGATTGDWLVVFRGSRCDRCEALESRLQGAAVKLKSRVTVARMSSHGDGQETTRRFSITESPQIVFFRQGVMYKYTADKYDLSSLSAFAIGLYKSAPSQPIPQLPDSPIVLVFQVSLALFFSLLVLYKMCSGRAGSTNKKAH